MPQDNGSQDPQIPKQADIGSNGNDQTNDITATPQYEYDAFISYRRRDGAGLAQWIRNKLQRFRLPPEILLELPPEKLALHNRRPRVWLDTSYEKASDNFLRRKVFPALDRSARLIVVATPAAFEDIGTKDGKALDNWLVREVDYFLGAMAPSDTNRPIDLVLGPGATEGHYPGRLSEEPRWDWIDFRSFDVWRIRTFTEALDDGFTKLVAAFYDVPDRFLPILRREERRRRQRIVTWFTLAGFSIAAVTTALMIWGFGQRADAIAALKNVLITRAQMSVRLSTEELQKNNPNNALATALAGVETADTVNSDTPVIADSVTAVSNSLANLNFGGTLRGHSDAVLKVVLGSLGRSAVTVGADGKAMLWEEKAGRPIQPNSSKVMAGSVFAMSQDGRLVVSGSTGGQLQFWAPYDPGSSPQAIDFGETPRLIALSENGQLLAALGVNGKLAVWSLAKGDFIFVAAAAIANGTTLLLGSKCNCIAVGSATGEVTAWSLDRKGPIISRGASGRVTSGAFGGDGLQYLFTTDDGRVWLTSAPMWPTPSNLGRHAGGITGLSMSPDGSFAATVSLDGTALIWDLTSGAEAKSIKPPAAGGLSAIAFAPDGRSIALAYGDNTVAIWDIGEKEPASEALILRGHSRGIVDLNFSPEGNWLASASLDNTARLWAIQTAKRPRVRTAHRGPAIEAESRGGRYLVTGGVDDKNIQVWSGPLWQPYKSIALENQPTHVAITEDGKRVFIGTTQGDLLAWDTSSSVVLPFSSGNGLIDSIAISPNEKTLAAIGVSGKLQICDVDTSSPQCKMVYDLGGWGYSVSFSSDGRWVGAAAGVEGSSGLAVAWDQQAKKAVRLEGHTERIFSIQFDHLNARAVTASWDGTARVWDLASGKEVVRLVEPRGRLFTAGFSSDDGWIATCSLDKTLRLWDVRRPTLAENPVIKDTGQSVLISNTEALDEIQFSPTGDLLAGSLLNGDINLWHVPDGSLRATLRGDQISNRTVLFQPEGQQITATNEHGNLLSWGVSPVLGLKDEMLLVAARSMLPLSGALAGKLAETPAISPSVRGEQCGFMLEHNIGLPPHDLSGAARARQEVVVPDSCGSATASQNSRILFEGLVAEAEGDLATASGRFSKIAGNGDLTGEIGLGDLAFVDPIGNVDVANAREHYLRAREKAIPHAASRIGWLLIAADAPGTQAEARQYFEESSKAGDADGDAGLAWMSERDAHSPEDIEAAFLNYTKAQYEYERVGDHLFADVVAERRAMLARFISPERVGSLFLLARQSIMPANGVSPQ